MRRRSVPVEGGYEVKEGSLGGQQEGKREKKEPAEWCGETGTRTQKDSIRAGFLDHKGRWMTVWQVVGTESGDRLGQTLREG